MSQNVTQRLLQHNSGKNKSTKNAIPWDLIWQSSPMDKTSALFQEKKVKKRGAKRFLEDLGRTLEN